MKKTSACVALAASLSTLLAAPCYAINLPVNSVPEIDGASAGIAVALLCGIVAIARARRKEK